MTITTILSFLRTYWKWVLIPVAIVVGLLWAYHIGYTKAQSQCANNQYKAAYTELQKQLAASKGTVAKLEAEQKVNHDKIKVVKETVNKYIPTSTACSVPVDAVKLLNSARGY